MTEANLEETRKKKILFVAGGVGTAPVYPQVKWLHEHGIDADVIVGAKTKDLVILEDKFKSVAGNLYVTTDDGSYGRSGMVTKVIEDLVTKEGKTYDHVRSNRTDDHDEVLLPDHKEVQYPDGCQHEPDYGRRYRYVRCLSCHCRR